MPTESENIQYLYLVLTNDGVPNIDWDAVGAALELSKGAVTKRWSRLKQSMAKGESPGGSTYPFLWLCVKHNKRDNVLNWAEIAEKCNTTSGAASKRYSRMKQAFEQDAVPSGASPRSSVKNTPSKYKATPKSTPKKTKAATSSGNDVDGTPTNPTPKRKRAAPKKKTPAADEQKFKSEPEDDDANLSDEEAKPKRAKAAKAKVAPKPKANGKAKANGADREEVGLHTPTTEATTWLKGEHDDDGDAFYDAEEEPTDDLVEDDGEAMDELSATTDTDSHAGDCAQCECHAKEIADVLMRRCSGLAAHQRLELEKLVGVVDLTD